MSLDLNLYFVEEVPDNRYVGNYTTWKVYHREGGLKVYLEPTFKTRADATWYAEKVTK